MLILSGCSAGGESGSSSSSSVTSAPSASSEMLAEYGLDGLDAAEVIDRLDAVPIDERSDTLTASVRPAELILSDAEGNEESLALPEDQFYVSVAPYLEDTHECYYHSLTTCLGELRGVDVEVSVVNEATGEVLVDETIETYDNGFVGLWLPRGIEATITIEYDGKSATSPIDTSSEDAATCLTTMQLA